MKITNKQPMRVIISLNEIKAIKEALLLNDNITVKQFVQLIEVIEQTGHTNILVSKDYDGHVLDSTTAYVNEEGGINYEI